MCLSIKEASDGVLLQMEKYGLQQISIHYYKGICTALVNSCKMRWADPYTKLVSSKFWLRVEECSKDSNYTKAYIQSIRRTIRMLDSFVETGTADLSREPRKKQYIPSKNSCDTINNIISETGSMNSSDYEHEIILRHFFCYIEANNISLSQITDKIIINFLSSASATNKRSMDKVTRATNMLIKYLRAHDITNIHLDYSLLGLHGRPHVIIRPFTQAEIKRMIEVVDLSTTGGKRDKAIIMLAYYTGIRGCDLVRLQKRDINWKEFSVNIAQKKTKSFISLPLNGIVMNAIADYIVEGRPEIEDNHIFISNIAPFKPISTHALNTIIFKYCKLANVERIPQRAFHSLRRSFASGMSAEGVPLTTITQMLAHKDSKYDRPYLMYNRSQISECPLGFDDIPIDSGICAIMMGTMSNRLEGEA